MSHSHPHRYESLHTLHDTYQQEQGGIDAHNQQSTPSISEKSHIFAAFGLWAPVYISVFTLACFLFAFALGRHSGSKALACDGQLHIFMLVSAASLFIFMIAFMVRDVREQRRLTSDSLEEEESELNQSEYGFDWLVWILRFIFLITMAGLALWGRDVLHARESAETDATSAAGEAADSTNIGSCAGRDADLVHVCWWLVVGEAIAAAVAGGVLIAQTIQGIFFD
jgi:hypothetical protein